MKEQTWIFVEAEGCIVRGAQVARLTPRAASVLTCLIKRRGAIVSRDDLLNEVWPGLHVTPDLVREYVFDLRAALGDDAKAPRYIETVRGKGFRLLGGVEFGAVDDPTRTAAHEMGVAQGGGDLATAVADKEYRIVTALYCAAAEETAPINREAYEAAHELMEKFFARSQSIIARHGGTIVQWLEDGFLSVFGAPTAHGDDARRAVLASLELNAALNGVGGSAAPPLLRGIHQVSIGIDTGSVVVGPLEAARPSPTYSVRGLTVTIAKQLQSRAPPGAILLGEGTYRDLRHEIDAEVFLRNSGSLIAYSIRGFIHHWAGVPKRSLASVDRFLGRKEELAILYERLARVRAHNPQFLSITGPPGIGKSRLLEEFRNSTGSGEVTFLEGLCFPHCKTTPYTPLSHLLRKVCGLDATDDPADARRRLRAFLKRSRMDDAALPALLDVLGLPTDQQWLKSLGSQARRARTFRALDELVLFAAARRPVVVLLEDVHWIDATSEEWLSAFIAGLGDAAILLLATYRSPFSPEWAPRAPVTQLALPPLIDSDSDALVRSILGDSDIRQDLVDGIVAKSEGNPFFLIELSHALDSDNNRSTEKSLPNSVQAILLSRIDGLEHQEKAILYICSIIGNEIPAYLLRDVCGADDSSLDTYLDTLQNSGFLCKSLDTNEVSYRFRHALIEEATYQSLPLNVRAGLHARIADALEKHFPAVAELRPEIVARHREKTDNPEAAAPYWQLAARLAYERSANVEAIADSRRGLALLEKSARPNSCTREELALLLTMAPALVATRGYGARELQPVYARVKTLCQGREEGHDLFRALVGIWNFHWVRGELDLAQDAAKRLLRLAERDGSPESSLRAHAAIGEVLLHAGNLEGSLEHLNAGIALYESAKRPSLSTQIPQVACLCYAAWGLWHVGRVDHSSKRAEEAVALAASLSHPLSVALCSALISELYQFRLEIRPCLTAAERAIAVSREQRFPFWEGTAMILAGWAHSMSGEFERGKQTMKEGMSLFADTGARIQHTSWLGMLAEVHCVAKQYDEGLALVEKARSWASTTGERYYLSELHRIEGDGLLGLGGNDNVEKAVVSYRRAITVAREQSARMRALRAAVSLARLLRHDGQIHAARAVLDAERSWLEESGDGTDLRNALSLRDSL